MRERERYQLAITAAEATYHLLELECQAGGLEPDEMMRRLKDLSAYSLTHAEIMDQREGVELLALAMFFGIWKTAGGKLPLPFENDALEFIYKATRGLPRDIIKVSNSALTHAYANRQPNVNLAGAQSAVDEHHLGDGESEKEEDVK